MRLTLCEVPTRQTRPDHNTGNLGYPTLCEKCVGSLTSPANHNREDAGDGAYPRRQERLTICGCHCKGSTFSSVIYLSPVVYHRFSPQGLPDVNLRNAEKTLGTTLIVVYKDNAQGHQAEFRVTK